MFWCSQFLSARESIKANFCFTYKWCDQTGGLIVQYCDICSYENLPNGIQNLPKSVQNLPNAHKTRQKVAKGFENYAKVRKFCRIWSHCGYKAHLWWCIILLHFDGEYFGWEKIGKMLLAPTTTTTTREKWSNI